MKNKFQSKPTRPFLNFMAFIASFWVIGIILAYWYGLGWFLLLQTVRRIIFAFPSLLIPWMQVTTTPEIVREMKHSLLEKSDSLKTSKSALFQALSYLLGTILIFWKANIPLKDILKVIINWF
jgi:ABC-type sulfate transport system permease subunit